MKNFTGTVLVVFAFSLGACSTAKVIDTESRTPASEGSGLLKESTDVLSEVFLKGSIDGKHMFIVLGMKDAKNISKDLLRDVALEKDLKELGHDIYNKEHKDDAYGRYRDSIKSAEKYMPDLFKGPWKSLKKIPNAYRINFERADATYFNSRNPVSGALKYSGWAVWANIQGAYYLIIEAPAKAALATVAVPMVAAVPTAEELIAVSWDSTKIVSKLSFQAAALAAVNTYSFVTSSTATLMTAMATGGVAIYKGAKWLIYGVPHRFGYPVAVQLITGAQAADQSSVAQKIVDLFEKEGIQKNIRLISKLEKFKSKLIMMGENDDRSEVKMGEILVSVEKAQVVVTVEFKRSYINLIVKEKGVSKAEAKEMLNEEAMALIEIISNKLNK